MKTIEELFRETREQTKETPLNNGTLTRQRMRAALRKAKKRGAIDIVENEDGQKCVVPSAARPR